MPFPGVSPKIQPSPAPLASPKSPAPSLPAASSVPGQSAATGSAFRAEARIDLVDARLREVDLQEVLRLGARHPLAERAAMAADADVESATASRRQAWWPSAGVGASTGHTDGLARIESPIGSFNAGSHEFEQLQWTARLPLLNASARLRSASDQAQAEASIARGARARSSQAMAAADRYLDALVVQARLVAARGMARALATRLERLQAWADIGRVQKSDLLRLRVDVAQAAEDVLQSSSQLRLAEHALATACGLDAPVRAAPLAEPRLSLSIASQPSETRSGTAIDDKLRTRDDLVAARHRVDSLDIAADAVAHEQRSPTLDLVLQRIDRHGIALLARSENVVSLQFSLPLFGAAVEPRQRALLLQRDAERQQVVDAERNARFDIDRLQAALDTAVRRQALSRDRIASADEALAQQRAQYATGRRWLDDVRMAEAELDLQTANASLLDIEVVRGRLALRHALGDSLDGSDLGRP